MMIRVGIIGLGDISKVHIPIIMADENLLLVAVSDIDVNQWCEDSDIHFYENYKEMLDQENLDSVHICLPHYLHAPVTMDCIQRGIHVFLEKPMGINLKEVDELVDLEKKQPDMKINLCLQNRLNNTSIHMKKLVESGDYGRIIGMKGLVAWHRPREYYDHKPWRGQMDLSGGGVMINQSIHTLDIMQWIGGEIKNIQGSLSQLLDYGIEVEDTASARLEFMDGFSGLFYATNANPYNASVELEVVLEKARLVIRDNILYCWDEEGQHILVEDDKVQGSKFYYGASHKKLIHTFYKGLESNKDDYIPVSQGLQSMRMIDAIRRSSETGKIINMEEYNG